MHCIDVIAVASYDRNCVSNHQHLDSIQQLPKAINYHQRKHEIYALLVLCAGNPLVTVGFSAQKVSSAEGVSISLRHHTIAFHCFTPSTSYSCPVSRHICCISVSWSNIKHVFARRLGSDHGLRILCFTQELRGRKNIPYKLFMMYVVNGTSTTVVCVCVMMKTIHVS